MASASHGAGFAAVPAGRAIGTHYTFSMTTGQDVRYLIFGPLWPLSPKFDRLAASEIVANPQADMVYSDDERLKPPGEVFFRSRPRLGVAEGI